jgi:DNA helicase-2/ATP-dependent DNA helicase PcrA
LRIPKAAATEDGMRKIRLQRSASDTLKECFARDLNEPQRLAATAADGFNLILAGPGSGKTRVITYRVAYLIARGVAADSILLVTFTRRAAREMVGRLESLIGDSARRVWAGTFHHIGNRILRRAAEPLGFASNFTILDGEDQRDLVQLAMTDAGFSGIGRLVPKAAVVQHLISYAFNVQRTLAEIILERHPDLIEWSESIQTAARIYADRKRAANCMDYDDLLGHWARLVAEFPEHRERQARMFQHILVDEMQDTNTLQVQIVESIARAGAGNLTAVGDDAQSIYRFRGANYDNILKFPERNPDSRIFRLEINYRSTPQIVAFTNASIANNESGFGKKLVSSRGPGVLPVVAPVQDPYEESSLICQEILNSHEQGIPLSKMAVLYRNHHDSILLQAELVQRGINYTVRSGLRFFEQAHIKDVLAYLRILVNPRDEPAWRRLLLLLPGIGPSKAASIFSQIAKSGEPLVALGTAPTMAQVPTKSKGLFAGFVADLRKIQETDPSVNPAAAITAILQGGYPATVRTRYDRPENRIADIEQMAVLAARYESLERLTTELLLAGDVYGMDSVEPDEPRDTLVLSTVHQAKGLEWSHVYIPRLIEDSFPHARSVREEGGEDEERRIFYVAVTRAMDQLFMTYPLTMTRPGRGQVFTTPSRFLSEVDGSLVETVAVEVDLDLAWTRSAVLEELDEED